MSRIRIAVPPLLAPRAYVWDITVISNRRRLKIPLLLALRAYNTKLSWKQCSPAEFLTWLRIYRLIEQGLLYLPDSHGQAHVERERSAAPTASLSEFFTFALFGSLSLFAEFFTYSPGIYYIITFIRSLVVLSHDIKCCLVPSRPRARPNSFFPSVSPSHRSLGSRSSLATSSHFLADSLPIALIHKKSLRRRQILNVALI